MDYNPMPPLFGSQQYSFHFAITVVSEYVSQSGRVPLRDSLVQYNAQTTLFILRHQAKIIPSSWTPDALTVPFPLKRILISPL